MIMRLVALVVAFVFARGAWGCTDTPLLLRAVRHQVHELDTLRNFKGGAAENNTWVGRGVCSGCTLHVVSADRLVLSANCVAKQCAPNARRRRGSPNRPCSLFCVFLFCLKIPLLHAVHKQRDETRSAVKSHRAFGGAPVKYQVLVASQPASTKFARVPPCANYPRLICDQEVGKSALSDQSLPCWFGMLILMLATHAIRTLAIRCLATNMPAAMRNSASVDMCQAPCA